MAGSTKRKLLLLGAMFGSLVILSSPGVTIANVCSLTALVVLGLIGLAMVRAALIYRQTGWISGLIMGSFFLVLGFGSVTISAFSRLLFLH